MKYIFTTKLSKEECIRRISTHAEKNTILANLSALIDFEKGILYRINGNKLMLKRPIYNRNSFQRNFHGSFIEKNGKTMIEGTFRIYLFVKIFMAIWFVGLAGIGGVLFLGSLQEILQINLIGGTVHGVPIFGIIIPPSMFALGIFIVKLGLHGSKRQEVEIIEFIKITLEAKKEEK